MNWREQWVRLEADYSAEITRLHGELELLADYIRDLLAELQHFKEADAKRPKTRDGVTVEPGMRVYLDWAGKTCPVISVGADDFHVRYTKSEDGWGLTETTMSGSGAFSSREACERWKEARKGLS